MSKMGKYFPFSDMRNFFEPERRTKIDSFIFLCYEGLLSFGIARAFFSADIYFVSCGRIRRLIPALFLYLFSSY